MILFLFYQTASQNTSIKKEQTHGVSVPVPAALPVSGRHHKEKGEKGEKGDLFFINWHPYYILFFLNLQARSNVRQKADNH